MYMYMFVYVCLFVFLVRFFNFLFVFARRPAMLGLMGFSGSLPLYVIHRYYIFVFIDRANKDACLLYLFLQPLPTSNLVHNLGSTSSMLKQLSGLNLTGCGLGKHPKNFGTF